MIRFKQKRDLYQQDKNNLELSDGVLRDIHGLQIVVPELDEVVKLKEFFSAHPDIEVLRNKNGESSKDRYSNTESEYKAIHLDVVWNPIERGESQLFNPHAKTVEIIILTHLDFMNANYGRANYWDRISVQRKGVSGNFLVDGKLQVHEFSKEELSWKEMVEERILKILTI